jgi:hypothetical protein
MWMRRVILRVGSGATPGLAGLGQDHPLALSLPTKSFWTKDEPGEGFQGAVHKKTMFYELPAVASVSYAQGLP